MFQNPGVPKESPRVRHGVCPIFPALCVMVWQCLIIFSKKCLSPLDNFGKRCYPLRIRKAALPYSGFRMLLPTKGRPFRQRMPFCSAFFRKKRRKLSHAHGQASITIRIPSPFRRFRRRAEALRAFFAVRIPAEPPPRLSFSLPPHRAAAFGPFPANSGGKPGFGFSFPPLSAKNRFRQRRRPLPRSPRHRGASARFLQYAPGFPAKPH